ncbi:hypothetical protein Tco_1077761 [Tanacetum coccineum]
MADDLTTSIHNLEVCQMQSLHRRCPLLLRASCLSSNTQSGGLWSGGLDLKKKGANRDQQSRDQRARSGDLWSGGLDPDRGANRD